jgi:hypothetical protein
MRRECPSPGRDGCSVVSVREALLTIVRDLEALEVRFALVGGLAVSVWTEPRTTRDVDVAVAVADDAAAEQLVFSLQQRSYVVDVVIEHKRLHRLATVRLRPPEADEQGALVDLLFASSGVEPDVVGAAERVEVVLGLVVPVASVGSLIAMKLLSRDDVSRPQDAADLKALLGRASHTDIEQARALAGRIRALGTDRGRDLPALLDEAVARHLRFRGPPSGPHGC